MPIDASRKSNRVTAGKVLGTSLMLGRMSMNAPITTRYARIARSDPYQLPYCGTRRCRSHHAPSVDATEMAIIRKYVAVRNWIVSGSPTDGGLAGYLSAGTM